MKQIKFIKVLKLDSPHYFLKEQVELGLLKQVNEIIQSEVRNRIDDEFN